MLPRPTFLTQRLTTWGFHANVVNCFTGLTKKFNKTDKPNMAADVSVCCRRKNVSVGVIKQENYIPETTLRKFWSLKVVGSQVLPCSEQQSEWSQFGEKSHRRVEASTHTDNIQADTICGISTPHHTWIKQLFIVLKYNLNYILVAMLTASIIATKQIQKCLLSVTSLILILIALWLTHVHSGSGLFKSNYCYSKKKKD